LRRSVGGACSLPTYPIFFSCLLTHFCVEEECWRITTPRVFVEALASAGCESEAIRVGEAVVDEGATASGAERVGGDEVAADDEYRY
jgi:hypothetical protein